MRSNESISHGSNEDTYVSQYSYSLKLWQESHKILLGSLETRNSCYLVQGCKGPYFVESVVNLKTPGWSSVKNNRFEQHNLRNHESAYRLFVANITLVEGSEMSE